jgi:hypothetical protein
MTMITLDALLRRMSRIAEQEFNKHSEIRALSIWLLETRDGEQRLIHSTFAGPIAPGAEFAHAKEQMAETMRQFFLEHDVVRYARAAECWIVDGPHDPHRPLSEHPQRQEVVQIDVDDGREYLMTLRKIIRPEHGKPYLDRLGEIERPEQVAHGRFLNLLPSRSISA